MPQIEHTTSSASVVSRERWLEWIKSRRQQIAAGEFRIEVFYNADVQVALLSPTIAVATGRNVTGGMNQGTSFRNEIRFTHVWAKENDRWRRAAFHDSMIIR